LKRNKALLDLHGLAVAVLDGHETSASYRRCCDGCLKRTTSNGQTQFYHRNVRLMLLCGSPPGRPAVRLLLDLEPERAGEGELTTALRLLERVLAAYPRAFDVLLADALYVTAPFLNFSCRTKRTRWLCSKMSGAMPIKMPLAYGLNAPAGQLQFARL